MYLLSILWTLRSVWAKHSLNTFIYTEYMYTECILCREKFQTLWCSKPNWGSRWQSRRTCAHSSCESTRITTNCWTIIDRKTLELIKKDTPHPKTKEKPQWDSRRGGITIKANLINTGWVTHKPENDYTTEVHPLEWRFWAPCQASQPGVWQWEEEFPENQTLKAGGIWLQDFDRIGGNRDSTLGGHTQSRVHIRT